MEEDAGKSFITLDMDEEREFRWNFRNIQKFEERSRRILKQHDVLQSGVSLHAGMVLTRFIRNADILVAAVAAATGLSGIEAKEGDISPAGKAIQAYLDKGGSLEKLQKEIYHSYLVVNDPSSVAEWENNLAVDAEQARIQKRKMENLLEVGRLELVDQEKKVSEMRRLSGNESPGSGS